MPIKTIALSAGYLAIVDACDFDRLNRHKWSAVEARPGLVYAMRHRMTAGGRIEAIFMHREVLGLEPGDGLNADHKNRIGTDNRRVNLREATPPQNQMNRPRNRNCKSGFKGVTYNATLAVDRRWVSKLSIGGVQVVLGNFADPIAAAVCYDKAAYANYGGFAYLNFPIELPTAA